MDAINWFVPMDKRVVMVSFALFMHALTQHLFTQTAEVGSEMVAWVMLPVLFRSSRHQYSTYSVERDPYVPECASLSSMHLWIIAVGLCISSWFKSEIGILKSFVCEASPFTNILLMNRSPCYFPYCWYQPRYSISAHAAQEGRTVAPA